MLRDLAICTSPNIVRCWTKYNRASVRAPRGSWITLMFRNSASVTGLVERLCRPQRIGVFGHRGVGKTTLVTLLYREAVAGRLPGLRLAAADVRTATYLSDKVCQLESGQPLPAT